MPISVPYINREFLYDSRIVGCLRDIIKMLFIVRLRLGVFRWDILPIDYWITFPISWLVTTLVVKIHIAFIFFIFIFIKISVFCLQVKRSWS